MQLLYNVSRSEVSSSETKGRVYTSRRLVTNGNFNYMTSKQINITLGTIIVLVVAVVLIINSTKKTDQMPAETTGTDTEQTVTTGEQTLGSQQTTTGSQTDGTGSTKPTSFTMAEVVKHNSSSDCWTTIDGGVYNVTSWISKHPGGSEAIISLCGIDGSAAFNDQHGGQRRPANELASFKIGVLAQ